MRRNNIGVDHMSNVFMTPEDVYDIERGKWEYNSVPEKMSYEWLIRSYEDFCFNYIDAFDTEDEHWTFIYENGNIINQDGDNGKQWVGDRWNRRLEKRNEKKLPKEERFKPIQRRGLSAIIYSNGVGEWYWYKNEYGKELLVEYTGWSFEQLGDEWL